ncbi:MAG: hypothetical protein HYY13_02505 [Nitrospirae bacterium]|nr:hypothetical protein [Nitrospirota bacterium]
MGYFGDTWEYTGDPTITLSLDCGGISACPMGTFGYRAVVTNPAQTTLTLRVVIAPGIGIPSPIQLLNQQVTGSTEIVHEYTTSDQIPNVCPTLVKVRAALLGTGATVVARDTCRIDFLPLTP